MKATFNTIETIRTDAMITNKSAAYLAACDSFEKDATQFCNNEGFFCKKAAEEVSLSYDKAKHADGEYNVYAAAHACECWLEKAYSTAL